jgi:hypothetical protein
LAIGQVSSATASEKIVTAKTVTSASEVRQEFDSVFGSEKIYQAIRKHLPEQYEELFQSYLAAKEADDNESFRKHLPAYINRIRNSYLKESSDQAILEFYRHTTSNGRRIFQQDPDAAFAYIFGGDPNRYADYVDFEGEMTALGGLFELLLASRARENLAAMDQDEVDNGMTLVFLGLYYRHGDNIQLLQSNPPAQLTASERSSLCAMYLDMYDEIFRLEPPTRNHVLRSLVMNM